MLKGKWAEAYSRQRPITVCAMKKKILKIAIIDHNHVTNNCHVNANHQVLFLLAQFFKRSQR